MRSGLRAQKEFARQLKDTLLQRRLSDFGELLDSAWETKKLLSTRISNERIDELYGAAREAGALGGKVAGAHEVVTQSEGFLRREPSLLDIFQKGADGALVFRHAVEQLGEDAPRLREVRARGPREEVAPRSGVRPGSELERVRPRPACVVARREQRSGEYGPARAV